MIRFVISLFILFSVVLLTEISAQLIINEVCASNKGSYVDMNGDTPDWIELYNKGEESISLDGYYISDNKDYRYKWVLPNAIIAPQSYLLILADGQDNKDELRTSFKLNRDGEEVILLTPDDQVVDHLIFPELVTDMSYGYVEGHLHHLVPSPMETNNSADIVNMLTPPIASIPGGVYDQAIELQLEHDLEGASIHFEINNRSKAEDLLYSESFTIDSTCCVCFWVTRDGDLDSPISCETYIINEGHSLPIISVIGDSIDLFSYEEGLFELGPNAEPDWPHWGANFWSTDEVAVHFQLYKDGTKVYAHEGALQIHGGREARNQPMRSFRLVANKFADDRFVFPFYTNKPDIQAVKKLVVRNASGDFNAGHIRDGFVAQYVSDRQLDLDLLGYEPVVCYLNGSYYGVMALREKADEYWVKQNYNIDIGEFDLLDSDTLALLGTTEAYLQLYDDITNHNMSDNNAFNAATRDIDMNSWIDYWIIQLGLNNKAWPHQNIRYWKPHAPGGQWRFILFDQDITMYRYSWTKYDEDIITQKMESYQDTNLHVNIFASMMENEGFRHRFANRHQDLFNTMLATDTIEYALDELVNHLDPEMPRQFDTYDSGSYTDWHDYHLARIRSYMAERPYYARKHLSDYFDLGGEALITISSSHPQSVQLSLNSLSMVTNGFSGYYFEDVPVSIGSKSSDPSLIFSHWSITNGDRQRIEYRQKANIDIHPDDQIQAIYLTKSESSAISQVRVVGSDLTFYASILNAEHSPVTVWDAQGRQVLHRASMMIHPEQNIISIPEMPAGQYILYVGLGDSPESIPFIKI